MLEHVLNGIRAGAPRSTACAWPPARGLRCAGLRSAVCGTPCRLNMGPPHSVHGRPAPPRGVPHPGERSFATTSRWTRASARLKAFALRAAASGRPRAGGRGLPRRAHRVAKRRRAAPARRPASLASFAEIIFANAPGTL